LVQRGAKVSRATHEPSSILRQSGGLLRRLPAAPLETPGSKTILKSSCLHLECRLPINLRDFLADQLGAVVDKSDEHVLNLAVNSDPTTLSKLARAIRRYSTSRAQQPWEQCSVPLADFIIRKKTEPPAIVLCLKCVRIDFGDEAIARHQSGRCVSLALQDVCRRPGRVSLARVEGPIADRIRTSIEEFRRLRVAFGLPHFFLDSYVRNHQVTFTWRPLA
jgi:hypothetical protein